MKADYFSWNEIDIVSADLAQRAAEIRPRRLEVLRRQTAALLVLDMQRYFLDAVSHAYIPSSEAIIPNILKLIDTFHQHDRPVVFTRHLNTAENAGQMANWWRDLISRENPLSEIDPRFLVDGSNVIEKSQYDAFLHTGLETFLRKQRVEQVLITGVMTHLCCETTARSAFMHGFDVFFTIDGTATYNLDLHWASLQNLAHGFAIPVLNQEVLESFRGANG